MDADRSVSTLVVGPREDAEETAMRLQSADGRIAPETARASDVLDLLASSRVDAVVSHHDLAGTSGIDLLARVRGERPDLPFFLIGVRSGDRTTAAEAGATDCVVADALPEAYDLLANNVVNAADRYASDRADAGQRYRQLLDSSPFPILVLAPDAEVRFSNRAADELLAPERPAGLAGQSLPSLVDPSHRERLEASVRRAPEADETVRESAVRVERTDGEHRHLDVALTPGTYRRERAVQAVLSDVTPYTEFNADLRALHSISSKRDADFEQKVHELLQLGCERFGLGIGFLSAIDRTFELVAARGDHPKLQEGNESPLSKTYCRKAIDNDGPLAVENASEEGWEGDPAYEIYGLSCYLGAKVVVDGELYGTLCFADTDRTAEFDDADLTMVDLMARWIGYEIERNRHVRTLREQNERFAELAGALSHDLGNLLEVARGHVEYALTSGETERLDEAIDAHDRAVTLVDHTVALARAGQEIDDPELVHLRLVAVDAWSHVEQSGADLEIDIADVDQVEADRTRLLQLFENLFRNSVEHSSTGSRPTTDDSVEDGSTGNQPESGDLTIRVGSVDGGFYVEDDGTGIPPEERETVFETGYSTGEGGTGLGLSIVERVVSAHGWDVRVTDSDAGGARFEVTGIPELEDPP